MPEGGVRLVDVEDVVRWGTPVAVFHVTNEQRELLRVRIMDDALELQRNADSDRSKIFQSRHDIMSRPRLASLRQTIRSAVQRLVCCLLRALTVLWRHSHENCSVFFLLFLKKWHNFNSYIDSSEHCEYLEGPSSAVSACKDVPIEGPYISANITRFVC